MTENKIEILCEMVGANKLPGEGKKKIKKAFEVLIEHYRKKNFAMMEKGIDAICETLGVWKLDRSIQQQFVSKLNEGIKQIVDRENVVDKTNFVWGDKYEYAKMLNEQKKKKKKKEIEDDIMNFIDTASNEENENVPDESDVEKDPENVAPDSKYNEKIMKAMLAKLSAMLKNMPPEKRKEYDKALVKITDDGWKADHEKR